MNNATDKSKATPFLERHKFTSMFIAFCLGLLVCVATTPNTEKAAHGKVLSPTSIEILDVASEPTDSMTLERSSNGNAVHHTSGVDSQSAAKISLSACDAMVVRDSLTSLRIRLQI